jgi:hypothetical protein
VFLPSEQNHGTSLLNRRHAAQSSNHDESYHRSGCTILFVAHLALSLISKSLSSVKKLLAYLRFSTSTKMKFSKYLILGLPILASAHPVIVEHTEIPNRRIQTHEDPIHSLHPRDSVTIDLKNSFSNSTVSNSQNNAKFEIVNNGKNANIAMGDQSNHTADFHSFGDKNMLNSTGSNTGGWNNQES